MHEWMSEWTTVQLGRRLAKIDVVNCKIQKRLFIEIVLNLKTQTLRKLNKFWRKAFVTDLTDLEKIVINLIWKSTREKRSHVCKRLNLIAGLERKKTISVFQK